MKESVFQPYIQNIDGFDVIGQKYLRHIAKQQGLTYQGAEIAALEDNITPCRYLANVKFIGPDGQRKLLNSKAAVIGCGAVGGMVCEILARLGVGQVDMIDFDVFEESNLNRQIMSTEEDIGRSKTQCAKERVEKINSAIAARALDIKLSEANALSIVSGCDIVFDGLDNARDKLILEDACLKSHVPLIHGAISDSMLQVAPIRDKGILGNLYAGGLENPVSGTPACTAVACAAAQAGEAVKILLGIGDVMDGSVLRCDWLFWSGDVVELGISYE